MGSKKHVYFRAFLFGFILNLTIFGMGYGLICAADVELILGTSSGFRIVRGTSVSAGTSTFFVGSSTVSIGTTTQAAMLTIAGSSTSGSEISLSVKNSSGAESLYVRNDGAILIGTNTSTLNSALYVGSATSGSLGTITAGFLSMGTISANAGLHGTTTVRFLADIFANGTITTGTKFVGDGSSLTGITATSLGSTSNINTTGTINAGSTTVSTLTTTGSATVSNTLTAASNTFRADSGSVTVTTRVGIGTSTPSSSYMLQITDSADLGVVVGSSGSITAKTLTVTGSATVSGTATAGGGNFQVDNSISRAIIDFNTVGIGTNTPSSSYMLQITDSADLGVVVGSSGSITAKTITSTGSITVSSNGTITAGFLSVGTVSASLSGHGTTTVRFLNDIFANGTITTGTKFVGDGSLLTGITATGGVTGGNISTSGTISAGSTTVSTLTTTGSATVTGALTAASNTFRADSGSVTVTTRVGIGTSTPSSSYRLQVTDDADLGFVVGSSGSITAKTLTVTGSATVTGALTAASNTFRADSGSVTVTTRVGIGTSTPSSAYRLQVTDDADLGFVVGSSGSITAKTITSTGSITASTMSITGTATIATTSGRVGIGTTTPATALHVIGTVTATAYDGIGTIRAVRKAADESVTSSTTLQDDDELQLTLSANTSYIIEGSIFPSSTLATTDIKIAFVIPSGVMNIGYIFIPSGQGSSAEVLETSGNASSIIEVDTVSRNVLQVMGTVSIGATGGTFKLQWAQFASSATATTVKTGSYIKAVKM